MLSILPKAKLIDGSLLYILFLAKLSASSDLPNRLSKIYTEYQNISKYQNIKISQFFIITGPFSAFSSYIFHITFFDIALFLRKIHLFLEKSHNIKTFGRKKKHLTKSKQLSFFFFDNFPSPKSSITFKEITENLQQIFIVQARRQITFFQIVSVLYLLAYTIFGYIFCYVCWQHFFFFY